MASEELTRIMANTSLCVKYSYTDEEGKHWTTTTNQVLGESDYKIREYDDRYEVILTYRKPYTRKTLREELTEIGDRLIEVNLEYGNLMSFQDAYKQLFLASDEDAAEAEKEFAEMISKERHG